jgi:hypothetical protein
MSHCRWVVVAEDCYRELTKAGDKLTPPQTAQLQTPIEIPEAQLPTAIEIAIPTEILEPPQKPPTKDPEQSESKESPAETDWVASLSPSFRKEAAELFQKLTSSPGFTLSPSGIVEIDGIPLEDYSISDFLRTACIPFNKAKIPLRLQDWLREQGLTTFRNHLLKILPKWQYRYSWRESTMAGRKGPSVAQKRSTRKRKG